MYSTGDDVGGARFGGARCKLTVLKSFSNQLPFKLNEGDWPEFFDDLDWKKSFDIVQKYISSALNASLDGTSKFRPHVSVVLDLGMASNNKMQHLECNECSFPSSSLAVLQGWWLIWCYACLKNLEPPTQPSAIMPCVGKYLSCTHAIRFLWSCRSLFI